VIEGLIERAATYLNIDGGFDGFATFVDQLNTSLGIPRNLGELGVNSPDLEALTRTALTDPCVGGNPVAMTQENTRQLFEALL
jgi:4-hydroxybutyrate dehydrogenase